MGRRKGTGWLLASLIIFSWFTPWAQNLRSLPDTWQVTLGSGQTFYTGLPLSISVDEGEVQVLSSADETLSDKITLAADEAGTAQVTLNLMGILPVKTVQVDVAEEKRLIPGGQAIGVALKTQGVMVVGTSDLGGADGASPARLSGIQPGDVITAVNEERVTGSQQLSELVAQLGAKPLALTLLRSDKPLTLTVTPKKDGASGSFRLGVWVRDSTAGVGTLSFYDPDTGRYGALGHAITDGDTGQLLTVSQGQVLKAQVVDVQKGQRGVPGELKGSFLREKERLGSIARNSMLGIYGTLDAAPQSALYPEGLPVGLRSTVRKGPAQILSCVEGEAVRAYDVQITQVNRQNSPAPKSMILKVTDPELLEKTGGIVQGMSGSPIIQDGKIIGAVTHVFVSDPTQGYGLYIDWMLEEAGEI
ncbi:MAG: SpoIVB peptidase [Clostridia bacterium]|nr:SpoIVB peptidase [Clostridia bacterium]